MAFYSVNSLPRAQLTPDYLHANSTTHEFLFGALAELVDNARDARATHLSIYTEENEQRTGGMVLCFLDDGVGMDPDEAADVIHLGKSSKRTSDYPFSGQYGNGLKSGAMRIGMDFILFTKKTNTMTCILLSRTFYEKEGIDEVIVPVPSWFVSTQEPIKTDDLTFSIEMALIYKYSPFSTEFDVMQQFHKITGSSGTLVIIYNVKLNDDGEPELDVVSDPSDLLLTGMVRNRIQPECYSFRAYAAILYIDPHMKIYIQGKKVCAKPLIFSLYRPRKYTYFSKGFKVRTLREVKEAELAVKVAEEKMQEAKLKMKEFEKTCDDGMEEQLKLAKARTKLSDSQKDVERKKKLYQEKLRALKKPIKLTFIFGVNIENRNCDGMFIYNNCRLIKMYKRIGVQLDRGLRSCDGVVGVVNVPSAMMEPTHNKQDFADAREYHSLLRVMGQCLLQYWKGLDIARAGIVKFWNEFGYVSTNWDWPPSAAVQYRRRRAAEIPVTVQCDLCLRWRVLPSNVDVNDGELPDPWICSMNQNPQQNRCDIAEQLPKIPSGAIKARSPLSNEKQERLEKSIQRHWVKVASLQSQASYNVIFIYFPRWALQYQDITVSGRYSIRSLQYQGITVSGHYSIRTLQYQDITVSGRYSIRALQYQGVTVSGRYRHYCIRVLKYQDTTISGHHCIRVLKYQRIKVAGHYYLRALLYQSIKVSGHYHLRALLYKSIKVSGHYCIRVLKYQDITISGRHGHYCTQTLSMPVNLSQKARPSFSQPSLHKVTLFSKGYILGEQTLQDVRLRGGGTNP
ncbi:ATPase MORC2-like [Rhinoraja longicauda]